MHGVLRGYVNADLVHRNLNYFLACKQWSSGVTRDKMAGTVAGKGVSAQAWRYLFRANRATLESRPLIGVTRVTSKPVFRYGFY